jgi:hypothetical protein
MMRSCLVSIVGLVAFALPGCVSTSYLAPGRAADMTLFTGDPRDFLTDGNIRAVLARPVLAQLPATLAVARVQEGGYASYSARGWGHGRYSVVTTRDIESDEDLERLADLEGIDAASRVGRPLLPDSLSDDRELRAAAASLGADLLLVYSLDTTFRTEDGFAPLTVVSLGLFPTKTARVSSTASAVILDTRSGHVYAACESTEDTTQLANAWTSNAAVDQSRRRAEERAWDGLLREVEGNWAGVVRRIAAAPAPTFAPTPSPAAWTGRPPAPPPPSGPVYHTGR